MQSSFWLAMIWRGMPLPHPCNGRNLTSLPKFMRHIDIPIAEQLIYTCDRSTTLICSTSCICGHPSVGWITNKFHFHWSASGSKKSDVVKQWNRHDLKVEPVYKLYFKASSGRQPRHGSLTVVAQHKVTNCIGPWWICCESKMGRPTLDRRPVTWKRAVLKLLLILSGFSQRLKISYSM